MKIAMIGHKRIPSREGGVELVVSALSSRMARQGHEVVAYNRRGKHVSGGESVSVKEYEGVKIKNVPTFENKKLNAFVYSVIASFAVLTGKFDVIHYHAEGPCAMLWLPSLLGIHTVATIHGLDWQRSKWGGFAERYLRFGERIAAKYAREVIVLSESARRYFMDTYGRETVFIPNGVEIRNVVWSGTLKEKYHIDKDGYILFLARIVPEKGLHYLIDAFKRTETDVKLVIAGGVSHSYDYMKKIEEMADGDDRIVFTGFVEGGDLWELYEGCRLYVLPSDVEGMPLTLLEAMGCGAECIVSDIDELTSVLGKFGRCFKKGNSDDLRDKLTEALNSEKKDTSQQREYIRNNYSWDNAAERTLEIYERVCGGR